jgi:peroxiredoxin
MKNIFFLSLFLHFYNSFSQTVSIKGIAKSFANKEIELYVNRDYISNTQRLLTYSVIDEKGNFDLEFDCKEIIYVTLKVAKHYTTMYAQPNQIYDVILQAPDSTTYQNPNIEHSIKISINLKSATEINALSMDYDKRFDDFLSKDYKSFVSRTPQAKIDSFRIAMKEYYSTVNNTFFANYIKYSIAALEEKTKSNPKKIYFENIKGKPILYNHPEYMNLFNDFYKQKLQGVALSKQGAGLNFAINERGSFTAVKDILKQDYYLMNDTIRELVLLKGLFESYYDNSFKKKSITAILSQAITESKISEHQFIAKNMLSAFSTLQIGSTAPNFQLPDKSGITHSLDELRTKKYVYLMFYEANNTAALMQMKLIVALKKKYGDKINFVAISDDKTNEALQAFCKKNSNFDWLFLYDNTENNQLRTNYELRSIPAYYFISPEGKFVQVPADSPEEDIDRAFFDATKAKRKSILIGDKLNPTN